MVPHRADRENTPSALFTAASRLRFWLPLYVTPLFFFAVTIAVLIVSLFVTYATPSIALSRVGAFNDIPVTEVFPDDADAQEAARLMPCQLLMNKGCDLLFPTMTNVSVMTNALLDSVDHFGGTKERLMFDQSKPYDFFSCDWVADVPPGTQYRGGAAFPNEVLRVRMNSSTLPDMFSVSIIVGCRDLALAKEKITFYNINQSDLFGLVDDVDELESGMPVAAPNITAIESFSTSQHVLYNEDGAGFVPCSYFAQTGCIYDFSVTGYTVADGTMKKCEVSYAQANSVHVIVCEPLVTQYASSPTLTTVGQIDYRYRAKSRTAQPVALSDPARTQSAVTGLSAHAISRRGLSLSATVTMLALVIAGVAFVALTIAMMCVWCNHRRARHRTAVIQQGMTAPPHLNVVGRRLGPRGEFLPIPTNIGDSTDRPLFEYEGERARGVEADDAVSEPYGAACYYREGETPGQVSAIAAASSTPAETSDGSRACATSRTENSPYGHAEEAAWNGAREKVFVTERVASGSSLPSALTQGHVASQEEHTVVDGANGPTGIPLRVEGNTNVFSAVGEPLVVQYVKHATRMTIVLVIASVVALVSVVLVLVILIAQVTGSMEHPNSGGQRMRPAGSMRITMNPEGGAIALYVIALIAALVAAVMVWCLLLCKVH